MAKTTFFNNDSYLLHKLQNGLIHEMMPSALTFSQTKEYLKDNQQFLNYLNHVDSLIEHHEWLQNLSVEQLNPLKSSLVLFAKASQSLKNQNEQYHGLALKCDQLICKLNALNNTQNPFTPLILELRDHLQSLESKEHLYNTYSRLLHLCDPISTLLLGSPCPEKKHLAEYTTTQKLIEILEHHQHVILDADERVQLYRGNLGHILEKYHVSESFLNEHTKSYLPIQK